MISPIMMPLPGHFLGANLLSNNHPQMVSSNSGMLPTVSACQTRPNLIPGPPSSGIVSIASPTLFPSIPRPTPADFNTQAPPLPFWPPLSNIFGFPSLTGLPTGLPNKNGPMDISTAYLLGKNLAFPRPPMPPYGPPQVAPFPSPVVMPKQSAASEPPSKKRAIDLTTSPFHSVLNVAHMAGGDCCPICRQSLPRTSSPQELRRHFVDDVKETEEQFSQLKRKLATGHGASASVGVPSSPDPAVKSRLDTFHRVRENRMMRMREKLTNMHISNSSASPLTRKILAGNDLLIRQSKLEKNGGRQTGQRSVASSESRSSSTTPRSTAPFRSPGLDEIAKTPTPASSSSLSPNNHTAAALIKKMITSCKLCSGTMECMKVSKTCHHVLCGQCWDRATEELVVNPVCPICSAPVSRQDIVDTSM